MSQAAAATPPETDAPEAFFLELTFNGGRFASHSLPIDAVGELSTVQQLIEKVARQLFLDTNTGKQRVPKGFFEAAQLHLVATADNCFTLKLRRPISTKLGLFESNLFETARNLVLAAIVSIALGHALPANFPVGAIDSLAALGRRLEDDESLVMHEASSATRATVTQATRRKFAEQINRPLEKIETVDGEIEQFFDDKAVIQIRTATWERIEVAFERQYKEQLVNALKNRPIERVRVRGKLVQQADSKRMQSIEALDIIEHERAPEIQKIWDRLKTFEQIPNGWMEGAGIAPTQAALSRARDILARLLVDHSNVSRPRIYPTPDGGVQAEWVIGEWVADIVFDPQGENMRAEATQTNTSEDRSQDFEEKEATPTDVKVVAEWLKALT